MTWGKLPISWDDLRAVQTLGRSMCAVGRPSLAMQSPHVDPSIAGTNGDGVSDGAEVYVGTDPNQPAGGGYNGSGSPGGGAVDGNRLDPEDAMFLMKIDQLRAEYKASPVRVSGMLTRATARR